MKLKRLKADGFGMLRGEWHFDPSRLNLVIDENERGKTSLLHAVVAGLYGLDRDGRRFRGLLTPLERWRPWDGGSYQIELDIESEGETYLIARDFARETVQVWNERGQDVTAEFATEKDDFSIGQQLLGLDSEEFAKCAFWRQGELAEVVPEMEKDRRASTLQARLESAADTRAGDASAIEAIQSLDLALKEFDSPELGTTLTIENALRRLEGLRDTRTVAINSLEHDYSAISQPLEQIAALDEEERSLRARLRALEAHAAMLRAADASRRLERDVQRRNELTRLRTEVQELAALVSVPTDAETVLAAQAARHSELTARLQALGAKRRAIEPERERTDQALAAFTEWAGCGAAHADALAVRAGELKRLEDEVRRVSEELDSGLEAMRLQGLDPERVVTLLPRFDGLTLEQSDLLREQPRIALTQQTELATAEQMRSVGRTMLRDIGAWKRPRYAAGGALAALGMLVAVAPLVPNLGAPRTPATLSGAFAFAAGIATIVTTMFARRRARDEATARIVEADEQQRRSQLHATENDRRLQAVATDLGYDNAQALLNEWGEAQRLRDLHRPIHAARQQLTGLERQRVMVTEAAHSLLEHGGGGEATRELLEAAAAHIRERLALEQERAVITRRLELADAEAQEAHTSLAELEQQAVATIRSAGLEFEPGGSWSAWVAEVGGQVRRALRRTALLEREIPGLETEMLDEGTRATLRSETDRAQAAAAKVDADALAAVAAAAATHEDVERVTTEARARLDALRDERESLRRSVQNVADRYHADHPGALARLEVVERELQRAQSFRDSVTLAKQTIERVARETHRRWAEFLNQRVTDLLKDVGSSIARVRFGEDLDFAVTITGGQQIARGKAVHQLSSGARDQLHLTVRLAISDFLSRGGESLPLLIDDCFATSDDDRTRNGMKLLLDAFSRQHQVVLVTCHRARQEALAALDAALYDERVHWVELRSVLAGGV